MNILALLFTLSIVILRILCLEDWSLSQPLTLISQIQSNAFLEILQNEQLRFSDFLEDYQHFVHEHKNVQILYQTLVISTSNKTTFGIPESIIRNGWRSIKWRLSHSMLVSSEDFAFISKALNVWGPNVSETAFIMVRISQEAFQVQNGAKNFQRDGVFGKMYPTLILMTFTNKNYQLQVVCPLCQDALIPPLIYLSNDNLTTVHQLIKTMKHEYSETAHGSLARLCQVGFRGNIYTHDSTGKLPGEQQYQHHRMLEYTAKWRYDLTADKDAIMLGILMKRFNFTYEMETWETLQGNYSGIYLNPGGDMPQTNIYGRHLAISYIISEFLMYCRKVAVIPATGWDFLWSPFDIPTWASVFVTGVVFSVLHRGQVSYGLDVLWCVLGIPYTSDWRRRKLLSYFLLALLNLNVGYLSVITSKVIIPNREEDIATPAELFQQGFRFIDKDLEKAAGNFIRYWGAFLDSAKINYTVTTNVLVQVDSCDYTHDPECISHWSGLATGVLYLHQKARYLLKVPANVRDLCHGVKKPFRSYWVSFYFQGPMASKIYNVRQSLVALGIDAFWGNLYKSSSLYDAYREANHTSSENGGQAPKLSFKTPILVVFKAYIVLISICLAVFPLELLFYYLFMKYSKVNDCKSPAIWRNGRKVNKFRGNDATTYYTIKVSASKQFIGPKVTVELVW